MSEGQTNPGTEVTKTEPQMNMFDVMFGSEESTNPEQASEPSQAQQEEVEEAPVEAQAEAEVEADVPEEVEEQYEVEEAEVAQETKEVDPVYRVKVDGEEFEVSLDELRDGYQRQSDYTRKSQSLAEQRKSYEANLQAVQSERQQYSKVLDNISQYQNLEVSKLNNIDWAALKEADPMEYMEKRIELQDAKDKTAQLQAEKNRINQQTQNEYTNHMGKVLEHEALKLREVLPEYSNPNSTVKQDLRKYALGLGFSEQDINTISDHRVVLVLHKAMLQDQATSGMVKKVSKKVPRVVKPGTPESKTQRNQRTSKGKRQRLQKSGHPRDAANVFLDMIS
jgi:hypothetical protein